MVVEGDLEVAVAQRLCAFLDISCPPPVNKKGGGNFWKDALKYNGAAKAGRRVFGLVDLEQEPCVTGILMKHLPCGRHPGFTLRLSKRMTEAWLLADRDGIASFLAVSPSKVPADPEGENHPKQTMVGLARRSRKRLIREAMVPEAGHSSLVGKEYFPLLRSFVEDRWDIARAREHSPSLDRALKAMQRAVSNPAR